MVIWSLISTELFSFFLVTLGISPIAWVHDLGCGVIWKVTTWEKLSKLSSQYWLLISLLYFYLPPFLQTRKREAPEVSVSLDIKNLWPRKISTLGTCAEVNTSQEEIQGDGGYHGKPSHDESPWLTSQEAPTEHKNSTNKNKWTLILF